MSDHDAAEAPARARWDGYLRRITIEDEARLTPSDVPAHVARRVLLDGREYPGLVNLRLGYSVCGELNDATVVSLYVDTEQVEQMRLDEASHEGDRFKMYPYKIAGIPVLTPKGHYWETAYIPDPQTNEAAYPDSQMLMEQARQEWTRVHLFVAEVEIVSKRDRPGDVVDTPDGGQQVVRECTHCAGAGHVLASGDPTFEQPCPSCGERDCKHLARVLSDAPEGGADA